MHLRCEICKGPENWCLDRYGEVWVRCMDEGCLAHQQTQMFPEESIWPEGGTHRVSGHETDDPDQKTEAPLGELPF